MGFYGNDPKAVSKSYRFNDRVELLSQALEGLPLRKELAFTQQYDEKVE